MYKKILLVVLVLFICFTSFSQEKDIEKIVKQYNAGQYEKCIETSKKTVEKFSKISTPHYYQAFSNFQMYKTATTKALKRSYITGTINYLNYALNKDAKRVEFQTFNTSLVEIHDTLILFSKRLYKSNKGESEFFYRNIAKIFLDTLPEYYDLFMPVANKVVQNLAFTEGMGTSNEKDIAGNRQGWWIKKYDNKIIESEIFFKDNHPAGIYRKYYPNGQLKAHMHFDEKGEKAAAILYDEKGNKLGMGFYNKQKKDSLWQYFINDSIVISEVNYKNGLKNGLETTYSIYSYPNILEETTWINDVQEGTWRRYFTDGKPQFFIDYKNGKRDGSYTAFDETGRTIASGQYKNNVSDGKWKYWDFEKNSYFEIEYINGVPKNIDKLSEEESKILSDMEKMQGKIQEPGADVYNPTYNNSDY